MRVLFVYALSFGPVADLEPRVACIGYTQILRPGVRANFGLALDTQRLNDTTSSVAAHKVGASFTFEG